MRRVAIALMLAFPLVALTRAADREPVLGGPCEGCELVFAGMPDSLAWQARIAPPDQPGEPLVIEGVVTNAKGEPAAGIIVYAYHTDARGVYPEASTRHGRLRGWARTDTLGRYRFDTIRPGAYPGGTEPQHVHMHVIEPGLGTYWIDSIRFTDDPLLRPDGGRRGDAARGGSGVVEPRRHSVGTWQVQRHIVLRQGLARP